jgi:hypothetical protein
MSNYPKRRSNLSWRQLGDFTLILDSQINKEVHHLNDVGALIWELCDGSHSIDEIKDQLCNEYDVTPDIALDDINSLLEEMQQKGLLE